MKTFFLPDLGEGLAEAEVREWHVNVGDSVIIDQPLVSVETAKAIVEIPSPQSGKILKFYGNPGDIIKTGGPLIEFDERECIVKKDQGTVVGNLEESLTILDSNDMVVGAVKQEIVSVKAMPAVRALAKQLSVDLHWVTPTGSVGQITAEDVKKAAAKFISKSSDGVESLHGVRRAMAMAMMQSHREVVPVSLMEDVDISHFPTDGDITVRIIQAVVSGVQAEPSLNVWFDGKAMERCFMKQIHVGLAMDTDEGLFVPVLKEVEKRSTQELRTMINAFKISVRERTVAPSDLQGATIVVSNFGTIAGRYATPVILPPMVAILGSGKIRDQVAVRDGKMMICRILPLSLTVDHRAVTGGEASRFLAAITKNLQK